MRRHPCDISIPTPTQATTGAPGSAVSRRSPGAWAYSLAHAQQDNPALSTIVDHGGHLVLVKRGERSPVWFKWQKRKPAPDVVAAHNGRVGLIPHSIGATALDVYFGDPSNLPKPWVGCRSRRPGGVHLYYGDDQARGNQNWQAAGCSGEVRSAKGYLIRCLCT